MGSGYLGGALVFDSGVDRFGERLHTADWTPVLPTASLLKGLVKKISETAPAAAERQHLLDQLLVELDIHFRIEDDLFNPALAEAGSLIAIAHAEHRQVIDQLSVLLLRTPPTAPGYDDEWHSFATVLEAHADEEERDMIPVPAPVQISNAELVTLGDKWLPASSSCATRRCTCCGSKGQRRCCGRSSGPLHLRPSYRADRVPFASHDGRTDDVCCGW